MGRASLLGGPPTLFIKQRFRPAPLDLCSRPMYMSFSTPSIYISNVKFFKLTNFYSIFFLKEQAFILLNIK